MTGFARQVHVPRTKACRPWTAATTICKGQLLVQMEGCCQQQGACRAATADTPSTQHSPAQHHMQLNGMLHSKRITPVQKKAHAAKGYEDPHMRTCRPSYPDMHCFRLCQPAQWAGTTCCIGQLTKTSSQHQSWRRESSTKQQHNVQQVCQHACSRKLCTWRQQCTEVLPDISSRAKAGRSAEKAPMRAPTKMQHIHPNVAVSACFQLSNRSINCQTDPPKNQRLSKALFQGRMYTAHTIRINQCWSDC